MLKRQLDRADTAKLLEHQASEISGDMAELQRRRDYHLKQVQLLDEGLVILDAALAGTFKALDYAGNSDSIRPKIDNVFAATDYSAPLDTATPSASENGGDA